MLRYKIDFVDFDGNEASEIHYFNLTKTELVELFASRPGGVVASLSRIIEAAEPHDVVKEFKELILLAYGVRSEDGKRFIKNDQVREEFSQTAAYDALFMKLGGDADAAAEWFIGVIPEEMSEEAKKGLAQATASSTPPVPPAPPTQ